MRTFDTGATRDSKDGKPQYEGYLSPLAIKRYGEYMLKHQTQADGEYRPGDNWQKGMPVEEYMDSLFRHLMDVWLIHRGWHAGDITESLSALYFNVQGMMHEILKQQYATIDDVLKGGSFFCDMLHAPYNNFDDADDGDSQSPCSCHAMGKE